MLFIAGMNWKRPPTLQSYPKASTVLKVRTVSQNLWHFALYCFITLIKYDFNISLRILSCDRMALLYMWWLKCLLSSVCGNLYSLNYNSCIFFPSTGLGRTAPDPHAAVTLDGVQVPLGKGTHTNIDDTSLLYNEYPLVMTARCMNLKILLPNDPTLIPIPYIIKSEVQVSLDVFMLFVTDSVPTQNVTFS